MTRKVGIFSGTFDPVHEGHVGFARQAIEEYDLDKVFFMVEPRPRRKQGVKAFEHRQRMVELAIKREAAFGSIVLEQDRFTAHHTLPLLKARFQDAELLMLMGDDMLSHLADWPHVDELLKDVGFIIGLREDSAKTVQSRLRSLEKARDLALRYKIFEAEHSEYASSRIRLAYKYGRPPEGLNPSVQEYIEANGLYAPA